MGDASGQWPRIENKINAETEASSAGFTGCAANVAEDPVKPIMDYAESIWETDQIRAEEITKIAFRLKILLGKLAV